MDIQSKEEWGNIFSHGIGAFASLSMLLLLASGFVFPERSERLSQSLLLYMGSLFFMFLCSTVYHSTFRLPQWNAFFRRWDHAAIYVSIAGTYTPFLLIPLADSFGITATYIIWAVAALGILSVICLPLRFRFISTACYLAMGWATIFMVQDLLDSLPFPSFLWLLAGGLAYTVGAFFYLNKKILWNHFIWHLFVLAGAFCHFVAIFAYLPALG